MILLLFLVQELSGPEAFREELVRDRSPTVMAEKGACSSALDLAWYSCSALRY